MTKKTPKKSNVIKRNLNYMQTTWLSVTNYMQTTFKLHRFTLNIKISNK